VWTGITNIYIHIYIDTPVVYTAAEFIIPIVSRQQSIVCKNGWNYNINYITLLNIYIYIYLMFIIWNE